MTKYDFLIFRLLRLKTLFQVEQHDAYELGPPLEPINLGIEEPKPGDIAITAVHTCTGLVDCPTQLIYIDFFLFITK